MLYRAVMKKRAASRPSCTSRDVRCGGSAGDDEVMLSLSLLSSRAMSMTVLRFPGWTPRYLGLSVAPGKCVRTTSGAVEAEVVVEVAEVAYR
jgi:hypothetical protein